MTHGAVAGRTLLPTSSPERGGSPTRRYRRPRTPRELKRAIIRQGALHMHKVKGDWCYRSYRTHVCDEPDACLWEPLP